MSKITSLAAAALALAAFTSATKADISYVITATYSDALSTDGLTDLGKIDISKPYGSPVVLEVDYTFTVANLPAGAGGFGDTAFDIALTGGLSPENGTAFSSNFGPSWEGTADTYSTGTGKNLKTHPLYSSNADAGTSTSDLADIAIYLANPPYGTIASGDTRSTLGQAGGATGDLGSAFILWNGVTPGTISLANVQVATYDTADSNFSAATYVPQASLISVGGSGVVTPEPASLGVLALGGLALLNRRRKA
jgi:hypothetical protein